MFAIKTEVGDPAADGFVFKQQKAMYFKRYRQATDKIVGLSDGAAAFLSGFF